MNETELTDRLVVQVRALASAIKALVNIHPSDPFERALARLLLVAYERRLRGIVETALDRVK